MFHPIKFYDDVAMSLIFIYWGKDLRLRLRLFRLILVSGNQFPENGAFGCAGEFGQTEIIFSLTGK